MASVMDPWTDEDLDMPFFTDDDDDGQSEAESFLTDEELAYQEGLDPAEDDIYEQAEEPSTSAETQQAYPRASLDPLSSAKQHEGPGTSPKQHEGPGTSPKQHEGPGTSPKQHEGPGTSPKQHEEPGTSKQDEEPGTSAAAGQKLPRQGRGHGRIQPRIRSVQHGRSRSRARSRHACRVSRSPRSSRSRSPLRPQTKALTSAWRSEKDPDVSPPLKRFLPARQPGHQLNTTSTYSPLDLFKLFVSDEAVQILCINTNKQAAKNIAKGRKYSWTNIDTREFLRFLGLTFFFALVRLSNIRNYWRKGSIFSIQFPPNIMSRDRYQTISWNVHMSDPDEDAENDKKKGTPDYDRLFRLKPLMNTITQACKTHYHPRQNISIDERMVATKAHTGLTQYMKAKPTKWGFKLFVLADCSNGYTLDFTVYTGKSRFVSGVGLAYDSVMSLIKPAHMGTGYHLYMDHFYTSPKLLRDLYGLNIGACGTYRDNRRECPRSTVNAMTRKAPRGSIRWIRDGPLVFVKWMDAHEVSVCSTIHPAFSGDMVQRSMKSIPCPTPVMEYNKNMRGVDLSDQLIQYYSVHHKTMQWYRTLFFHFLDIAATNSYLLHRELCKEKQQQPLTHRAFLEELTAQLCGVTASVSANREPCSHVPVPTSQQTEKSKRASYGRKPCVHCRMTRQVNQATPWKCQECDVALCIIPDRNCFAMWHK